MYTTQIKINATLYPAVAVQSAQLKMRGSQGATEVMIKLNTGVDRSYLTNDLLNA